MPVFRLVQTLGIGDMGAELERGFQHLFTHCKRVGPFALKIKDAVRGFLAGDELFKLAPDLGDLPSQSELVSPPFCPCHRYSPFSKMCVLYAAVTRERLFRCYNHQLKSISLHLYKYLFKSIFLMLKKDEMMAFKQIWT